VTLNLAETSVAKSRPSVPYGANLFLVEISALNCFQCLDLIGGNLTHKLTLSVLFQHKWKKKWKGSWLI